MGITGAATRKSRGTSNNGIRVIGSDRGGTPETLGDAGIVVPTADEVAPRVEAILRLWDDPQEYARHLGLSDRRDLPG